MSLYPQVHPRARNYFVLHFTLSNLFILACSPFVIILSLNTIFRFSFLSFFFISLSFSCFCFCSLIIFFCYPPFCLLINSILVVPFRFPLRPNILFYPFSVSFIDFFSTIDNLSVLPLTLCVSSHCFYRFLHPP